MTNKQFTLRIERQDHPSKLPYWQSFAFDQEPGLNITSVLQRISANPTTNEGLKVSPVAYESANFPNHLPEQLSNGQRQRVAIARALANEPAVVLADEPTGALDSTSGAEVMQLLVDLNVEHGTTLVVVTHDQNVAAGSRRIVRMMDGRITEHS